MNISREKAVKLIEQKNKDTVFAALGIQIEATDSDVAVSLVVGQRHLQHAGIVHGGIYVLLAESAASIAGALEVGLEEFNIFGMEINANHLKPTKPKVKISAIPELVFKGKSSMVYTIRIVNEKNELVSVSRCTLAYRKK